MLMHANVCMSDSSQWFTSLVASHANVENLKVNHSCDADSGDLHDIQNLAKVSFQFEIGSLTDVGFVYWYR